MSFKIWFSFSFVSFFIIATHLRAILLLQDKNIDSIVGFWFNVRTSTVKIVKNHSLVYKIAFVAFELKFKKCHHDRILFLVDRCRSKPVYHLMKMSKGRWLCKTIW